MPDLTDPKIFPAVLGVGGVVFTVLVNAVFTVIHKRIDFNHKRFFDAHNRRLAVYEEVINALDTMMRKHDPNAIKQLSGLDVSSIIIDCLHTLNVLNVRLRLYGSLESVGVLAVLVNNIAPMQDQALNVVFKSPADKSISDIYILYVRHVEAALQSFVSFVYEETGKDLVDKKFSKKIKKVFEKFINRAKGVKRQNNKVDNN